MTTAVSFAMFGLLFAMPQYFQEVRGADALGSGLRLLPMVGGMLAGMISGARLSVPTQGPLRRVGTRARRCAHPHRPRLRDHGRGHGDGSVHQGSHLTGYGAAWIAIAGLGLGLAMPPAMNVALSQLSAERSGSGSAVISALRQVGATIGVAILGTLISNAYTAGCRRTDCRPRWRRSREARSRVVSRPPGCSSRRAAGEVRTAFVHGMDIMLWTCGGIALAAALLGVAFLPGGPRLASLLRRTRSLAAGTGM